jgi:hypothetical protein
MFVSESHVVLGLSNWSILNIKRTQRNAHSVSTHKHYPPFLQWAPVPLASESLKRLQYQACKTHQLYAALALMPALPILQLLLSLFLIQLSIWEKKK